LLSHSAAVTLSVSLYIQGAFFLLHIVMLKQYVLWLIVCPSVCLSSLLSITCWYCIETV